MFVPADVAVAGFDNHVNSLAYCARPFTIEHLQTYRQATLACLNAASNAVRRWLNQDPSARNIRGMAMMPSVPTIALCSYRRKLT